MAYKRLEKCQSLITKDSSSCQHDTTQDATANFQIQTKCIGWQDEHSRFTLAGQIRVLFPLALVQAVDDLVDALGHRNLLDLLVVLEADLRSPERSEGPSLTLLQDAKPAPAAPPAAKSRLAELAGLSWLQYRAVSTHKVHYTASSRCSFGSFLSDKQWSVQVSGRPALLEAL